MAESVKCKLLLTTSGRLVGESMSFSWIFRIKQSQNMGLGEKRFTKIKNIVFVDRYQEDKF